MSAENGCLTASVLDRHAAVDPYVGVIVHRTEMQDEAVRSVDLLDADLATIPHNWMEAGLVHAGQTALRWVRHEDLAGERLGALEPAFGETAVGIVECEAPTSAKIGPTLAP